MENDYLPYGKQNVSQNDVDSILKVLNSEFITQGPVVKLFENEIAKNVCSKYAVAHNSATSALHTACLALGLGSKDYIWTSPITFVASANCGIYCGANVDFVDIDPKTGLMSINCLAEKLKIAEKYGKLPKIVIPVHLGGSSCDMHSIKRLSDKYGFLVIEDASHALGGKYLNAPVGNCKFSDITIFSFHPVKIITCGEGGMACTNDLVLAEKLRYYSSHGIIKDKNKFLLDTTKEWGYEQQALGFNYRLSDIHAALGISQLKRLNKIVMERNRLIDVYKRLFYHSTIKLISTPDNVYSSYHLGIVKICNNDNLFHHMVFKYMRENNIGVQLHYSPVHLQPFYLKKGFKKGDFPHSEYYSNSFISIPLFVGLKEKDQIRVVNTLEMVIKSNSN